MILLGAVSAAHPKPPKLAPEAVRWTAVSIFEKNSNDDLEDQPRMNLSGAACVPTTPKFTSCLIANDEKKYAQFFSIDGNRLTPRKLIRLSDADNDPDAEGVAYDSGFFYVIGSHGRSRHGDSGNRSSYAIFRIPVDPTTGIPSFEPDEERVVAVVSSSRLRRAIRDGDIIKKFFDRPLAKKGVNIEGIAVRNGRMHLGLRGPSVGGNAFILSVDADAVFTEERDLKSKVTPLALGRNTGIRDLAAVEDGVLILAGPTRDEKVPYAIWFWDGTSATAKPLATLDLSSIGDGAKAEILLPLEEDRANTRVLVMFDGVENGGAVSFKLPR
ncbi:DUF3616 domain-containing protein [Bradyrhizobium sp. BRP22]|uniref:DUF3616 domain-containing protein n=1 Tax=Bradyrhizobium sp. BRP22 TaxID=2793821 RepID=UPI001CD6166B|nr:DUF3616 domain-containing protein [Bradyrhizobium sp. BRP22]MCA1455860.1 DUF3616 domain-containing protein [Bradyrhizobium sp. BRP22]